MPTGFCNAAATFQIATNWIAASLGQKTSNMIMSDIDDILIATESVKEHMFRLREVFHFVTAGGFKCSSIEWEFLKIEFSVVVKSFTSQFEMLEEDFRGNFNIGQFHGTRTTSSVFIWFCRRLSQNTSTSYILSFFGLGKCKYTMVLRFSVCA